jgi:hypothetical protein
VEIPFDPTAPFRGAFINNDVDDAVDRMAHMALTVLCECSIVVTADTPPHSSRFVISKEKEKMGLFQSDLVLEMNTKNLDNSSSFLPITHMTLSA